MPTFIVHELGKNPQTATFDKVEIVIGREADSDIVLNNVSVSRQHAVIQQGQQGWAITPLNAQNPLVVNGVTVPGRTPLGEGAELQVGRFMVIFSLQAKPPAAYMTDRQQYEARCDGCGWTGVLSALSRSPACPKCGGVNFSRADDLVAAAKNAPVLSGPTAYLRPEDVEKMQARMKEAKQAKLERLGGSLSPRTMPLAEDRLVHFGKEGKSEMPIEGFMWGKPSWLAWNRAGYAVHKGGFLPKIKVNGEAVDGQQVLKDGDTIEAGKSTFRFVVG
jgi:predicted component of type VI protein secretion system